MDPSRHEVILVDGSHAHPGPVNRFKDALYRRFGIQSDRYEDHPEYSQHVQIADAAYQALEAIAGSAGPQRFLIAHEFMGMPLCYSAMLRDRGKYATVFYGHEVATVRPIVEFHPGHDTMFYSVLAQAQREGRYLEEVFGDQSGFFKHAPDPTRPPRTVTTSLPWATRWWTRCASSGPSWEQANIDLVYNGVPSHSDHATRRNAARATSCASTAPTCSGISPTMSLHTSRALSPPRACGATCA